MDEAEALSDQILILANGKLSAAGTPLFLKHRFAKGYTLSVQIEERPGEGDRVFSALCDACTEWDLAQAEHSVDRGTTLQILLPFAAQTHFPHILAALQAMKAASSVGDFGISTATLDEVFIEIAGHESGDTTAELADAIEETIHR
ncbi:ABC transporter A, ABCA [Kipferlia bialata]|uniref:ABC transporter A, ABCA n=1 Tax=Kipferlia bialata TaxID=797122 RepID=A0A391NRH7_9EUKA|nr:ABC transporter A, ABCA [Kipferlia bialata]|eukprot:g250.t1